MLVAPVVVVGSVLWLLRYSYRTGAQTTLTRREALELLTDDENEQQAQDLHRRGG
jgi:hypothetical protein